MAGRFWGEIGYRRLQTACRAVNREPEHGVGRLNPCLALGSDPFFFFSGSKLIFDSAVAGYVVAVQNMPCSD